MTCEYIRRPTDGTEGGHHERIDDDRHPPETTDALC